MSEKRSMYTSLAKDGNRGQPLARGALFAVITLVVLGCALRTAQYLGGVFLWHDELAIALNVEQKGLRELLTQPLGYQQVAPVGFLAAVAVSGLLDLRERYSTSG